MENWMIWLSLAAVAVILEIVSGTFYLVMIATGLVAGALIALAGGDSAWQFVIAAITGVAATVLLRRSKFGKERKGGAARDPNVNLDIGQTVEITEWKEDSSGRHTARAMYRGALWDIELAEGEPAQPGSHIIREVRGSALRVSYRNSQ